MKKIHIVMYALFITLILENAYALPALGSEETPPPAPKKINITSDTLIFDNEKKFAEFIGNVEAVEENSVLTADKMKVFFNPDKKPGNEAVLNNQSIEKILATGNVEIKFDNNLAVSEQAEYSLKENLLILTGDDTKVKNGENQITGDRIIINRLTGSVTVQGNETKRVEAQFFSNEDMTDSALKIKK